MKPKSSQKKRLQTKKKVLQREKKKTGVCLLSDGSFFQGLSFGAQKTQTGEFVFQTSHTGYQEVLTDPSYTKQVLVFSAAHIGNQGFHPDDWESSRVWASGCIVRNYTDSPFHWRWKESLDDVLKTFSVPGLFGVDTRRLVLKVRQEGCLWGVVSTETDRPEDLQNELKKPFQMEGLSLVKEVSTKTSYSWVTKSIPIGEPHLLSQASTLKRCVVMDFGVKRQILRYLLDSGFEELVVVPSTTTAEEIFALRPDAVLLSNGPGDPAAETSIIEEVKKMHGRFPIFGICLGHQILGLSLGLKTKKLKFGHHAANHPVRIGHQDRVEITSQNHGFAVLENGSSVSGIEFTHRHMNDQSISGFQHRDLGIYGIQYHPESSPGPLDSLKLFEGFRQGRVFG